MVKIPSGKHALKVDGTFSGPFRVFSQTYQFDSGKIYRFVIAPNKTEIVANTMPFGVAEATYYEANKGSASSNNGDFTMKKWLIYISLIR